jgi:hypothetical protein
MNDRGSRRCRQRSQGPQFRRIFRPMFVGLLVTAWFVVVFLAIGVPVTLGASRLISAISGSV